MNYSLFLIFLLLSLKFALFYYFPILSFLFDIINLVRRIRECCKFDWSALKEMLDFVMLMLLIYRVKDRYFYTFFNFIYIFNLEFLIALCINSLFLTSKISVYCWLIISAFIIQLDFIIHQWVRRKSNFLSNNLLAHYKKKEI
jgi:hypothetical protein